MPEHPTGWDDLQRVWRTERPDPIPDLVQQIHRRTRRIWALTIADGIATVALLALLGWLARDGWDRVELAFAGFVGILLLIGWSATLWLRRGSWRAPRGDFGATAKFALRRCNASIALARLNQVAVVIGVITGLWLSRTDAVGSIDFGFSDELRSLLRLGAIILFTIWLGAAEWYARGKQVERRRLRQALADWHGENDCG